jgi:hexosaminidase
MNRLFFILLLLISLNGISQNDLMRTYSLMPWPKHIEAHDTKLMIDSGVTISILGNDEGRVRNAAVNFLRRLSDRTGVFMDQGFPVKDTSATIRVHFDAVSSLGIDEDESYSLEINNSIVLIKAATDVGALRALATLLQLTSFNDSSYYFPGVTIEDSPRFVWRGLMIDVARHFQPVDVLKRNLDAMASVKLNVFHWHLTDDQGFRVESKVYPRLHEVASDGLYYTQEQIKDIVSYASNLGIRVVPEFDVPGHASAILTAYPELGSKPGYSYSIERFSGVFDPTLNPTIDLTYEFLENLFTEITPLFPDAYFHIGGDENEGKHWDENEDIQKFMAENGLKTNHDLQTWFNIKLEKILNRLGKNLMGWDEIMTPDMPTSAVIHSWRGENEGLPKGGTLISAAKAGYKTVLSNGYYIDRMFSVEHHYSVDPIGDVTLTTEERARILGGEATMWSELVTPLTIDSRIWPRTAAIAERFWSPQEINDIEDMRHRLKEVNFRLEALGINHIRNRDVILRIMTNSQDINGLIILSKICEPLKLYSRNQGGTEYKTFSPFTLFADACTADAADAVEFKKVVNVFTNEPNNPDMAQVLNILAKWSANHKDVMKVSGNPNVKPLIDLSQSLAEVATLLTQVLNSKSVTRTQCESLISRMITLNQPVMDVELAIVEPLNDLISYCKQNYLEE